MAHNMLLTLSYCFQLISPSPNSTQITFDILYQTGPHITPKWNTKCIGCTNNLRRYFDETFYQTCQVLLAKTFITDIYMGIYVFP